MTETQIDLSRLAYDRTSENGTGNGREPPQRKWITRYVIPVGILLGFCILIFAAIGDSFWPKKSVEVIPVIVKRATSQQEGTQLFQAAGWIEPSPTAINVPALAPGVIDELLVVEGQAVKKGNPIAKLISIDAEIAINQARADVSTAEANLKRALAEQQAAKIRLEQPIHLQIQLADAKSNLARAEREMAALPLQIETAEAELEFARKNVEGKRAAGKALAGIVLKKAESEFAVADATLRELQQRKPGLKSEIEALQEKLNGIEAQLKLLVDETRQLGEADAKVDSATALRDAAKLKLQKAELDFARNTVRAPIDGRILRLISSPGMRVMGLESNAGHNSSSVVEMYDPNRLQVRADVRLEDVPLVQAGQPVEVETPSSPKTIKGRVLQATSKANIQKNTLEVKIELFDPPSTVRPEMLVTATFLAPKVTGDAGESEERERLFVPKQLVKEDGSDKVLWIVDEKDQARKVNVTVGNSTVGDLIEIISGVQLTDKLITSETDELRNGSLVNVSGEDHAIGR